ncbi:peptidyl-prolyl cis-trans isomerase [Allorhizobium borbori]|uniref:Parvulin-like PPIase n=1 Tax=Allorhizobium borbori TaxID=485907 RepID=A0A7W6P0R8_9HYPH|nr:peptidyl-prolyl cis-trans isomerase [Allorhizobium borbori]MBB4103072.1 peptidyl-prolyl cis-trans isomerase C [Allorhizobium borbori]
MISKALFSVGVICIAATAASAQEAAGPIAARVNGVEITTSDVAFAAAFFGNPSPDAPTAARTSAMVDAMIDIKLLAAEARRQGIEKQADYQRQLNFLAEQALRSAYLSQEVDKAVTDESVRAFYDKQVKAIAPVQEIRLSHILLKTREEADKVSTALASGQAFETLAKESSADTVSGREGGSLSFLKKEALPAEIASAVAGMKPGEVAKAPIQTPFGFHVVRLDEVRNAPPPSFEELAPRIRQSLESAAIQSIVARLRTSAKIEKLVPDVPMPADSGDGHNHDGNGQE